MTLTGDQVVRMFQDYSAELGRALRAHSVIRPFMLKEFSGLRLNDLIRMYGAFLLATEGYVHDTVPLLTASGEALKKGDKEDRAWSGLFLKDAKEETDIKGHYGHDRWAYDDRTHIFKALPPQVAYAIDGIRPPEVATDGLYHQVMVLQASQHPYSGLGAKGVLEHLAVNAANEMVEGIRMAMPNVSKLPTRNWRKDHGVTFLRTHGVLDIKHTETGNWELKQQMRDPIKLEQIAFGAEVTRAFYHNLIFAMGEMAEKYRRIESQLI